VAAPDPTGVAAPDPAGVAAPDPAAGAGRPAAASGPAGASAVTLTFADGGAAEGDLVVAADGRGSALRDQLWGGDPGQLTGWATWQGISPLPSAIASSRRSVLFVGRPGTCGLMPAGDGLLQWWFDLRWAPGSARADKPVAMLRERFADWAPPVQQVLDAVTDEETGFFPHYRHRVPKTWGRGPVTVIGDAAHSMPPTRAQGANQALEDAWALAAALRGAGSEATGSGATGSGATGSGATGRGPTGRGPTGSGETGTAQALRAFEGRRAKRVSIVSRQAGSEDYNRYGALLSRLVPGSLATRYYTRWLGQISNYLGEG
jgi:FAD-dependent urate hydroxylase